MKREIFDKSRLSRILRVGEQLAKIDLYAVLKTAAEAADNDKKIAELATEMADTENCHDTVSLSFHLSVLNKLNRAQLLQQKKLQQLELQRQRAQNRLAQASQQFELMDQNLRTEREKFERSNDAKRVIHASCDPDNLFQQVEFNT